jgi:hypothetical protein
MLQKIRSDAILECYREAAEARRTADAATNPEARSDFLVFEQWWFSLARNIEFEGLDEQNRRGREGQCLPKES